MIVRDCCTDFEPVDSEPKANLVGSPRGESVLRRLGMAVLYELTV